MVSDEAVVYRGPRLVVECMRLDDGSVPVLDFLDGLAETDRAKLQVLFTRLGDMGFISNREKYRKVRGKIWEVKSFQIRILMFHSRDGRAILAHHVIKKGDDLRPQDIERAEKLRDHYFHMRGEAP